ncbi:hypothetical protein OKW21_003455 [Catalinimonas alkaloidigena]|uniref:hypothetical protein n=1 Tax=Catalinimonas alkaloidigena TaxID=1075417 RepID=UPI002404DB56|nr:hypothetical protein [Catalinimonas alkaloidigena]MDF9798192.1 hypothetical protein [Catalinimonas alkaloidigena]
MKKNILLLVLFVSFISCEEDLKGSTAGRIKMMMAETQCANPWAFAHDQEVYMNNIRDYLKDQGVKVLSLELKNELAPDTYLCEACNCWSGNNLYINIADEQRIEAEALGFTIVKD